jgi:hypothetical protein
LCGQSHKPQYDKSRRGADILDAVERGTAKENLDLLSKVIVGLKRNRLFEFDRFQEWCTILESLTRDEILFIGAAYRVISTPQSPPFWEGVRTQLVNNTFTNDEVESLAAALARTGLIIPLGALSGTTYVSTKRLKELGDLALQNV